MKFFQKVFEISSGFLVTNFDSLHEMGNKIPRSRPKFLKSLYYFIILYSHVLWRKLWSFVNNVIKLLSNVPILVFIFTEVKISLKAISVYKLSLKKNILHFFYKQIFKWQFLKISNFCKKEMRFFQIMFEMSSGFLVTNFDSLHEMGI